MCGTACQITQWSPSGCSSPDVTPRWILIGLWVYGVGLRVLGCLFFPLRTLPVDGYSRRGRIISINHTECLPVRCRCLGEGSPWEVEEADKTRGGSSPRSASLILSGSESLGHTAHALCFSKPKYLPGGSPPFLRLGFLAGGLARSLKPARTSALYCHCYLCSLCYVYFLCYLCSLLSL